VGATFVFPLPPRQEWRLSSSAQADLVPVDIVQGRLALSARTTHGRGMGHGGTLNFGDAFSYALAKSLGAALLFVGNDFAATDVRSALALQ